MLAALGSGQSVSCGSSPPAQGPHHVRCCTRRKAGLRARLSPRPRTASWGACEGLSSSLCQRRGLHQVPQLWVRHVRLWRIVCARSHQSARASAPGRPIGSGALGGRSAPVFVSWHLFLGGPSRATVWSLGPRVAHVSNVRRALQVLVGTMGSSAVRCAVWPAVRTYVHF